jgi:hypothetical protein
VELGEASPVGELRRLLEEVADSSPASARGAQTRLAAIEVLERLDAPLRGSAPTPSPPLLLCQCGSKSLVSTARSQFVHLSSEVLARRTPPIRRGCRIKPFRKPRGPLAEWAASAAERDDLPTDDMRVTDEMAVFGARP